MRRSLLLGLLLLPVVSFADTALTLYDSTTHYVQIRPTKVIGQTFYIVLPSTPGTSGQVLGIAGVSGSSVTMTYFNQTGSGGGGGGGVWGSITGTMSSQTDLQTALNSIGVATGTLNVSIVSLGASTGTLQVSILALGVSTGTLLSSLNALALSTGTLSVSTTSLQSQVNSIGVSTGTIQTQINSVAVATGTLVSGIQTTLNAIAVSTASIGQSTTTLQTNINAVGLATGTIIPTLLKSTNTWTGSQTYISSGGINVTFGVVAGSVAASSITASGAITAGSLLLNTPLPVASGGSGTNSPGLIPGTNITSITGSWPNQTINAAAQSGGSGGAPVAVSSGGTVFTTLVSSPTRVVLVDSNTIIASLLNGNTAFLQLMPSSVTLQGNIYSIANIAADTGTIRGVLNAVATSTNAIGVSTGSLQTQITATALSTQTLANAVGISTGSLQTQITATALSTQTLANAVGASTASLQTTANTKVSYSSFSATQPILFNNVTGVISATPVSLSSGVMGNLPAASIAAGTLGPNVIASSIAVQTITSSNVVSGTFAAITGIGNQTQPLNMNSNLINNVTNPVSTQDAATKNYVDATASGLDYKQAAVLATTGALPANIYANGASGVGATLTGVALAGLSIDGQATTALQRVLIKNEADQVNNGIYTVTATGSGIAAYVLTRAVDYNQPSEIQAGDAVFVSSGATNVATGWVMTNDAFTTVGTSTIPWAQFAGAGTIVFSANGSNLTSQNAINFQNGSTVNGQTINMSNPSNGNVQAAISGNYSGSGAGITSITGANIVSGIPFSVLPSTIATTSSSNTWTAFQGFGSSTSFSGGVTISSTVLLNGSPGTNGQSLLSGGNGAIPSWGNPSASVAWGGITGTMGAQTDLQTALFNVGTSTTAIGVATGTLTSYSQTLFNAIAVSTAAVGQSTNTLQLNINAVGLATGTIVPNLLKSSNSWTAYQNFASSITAGGAIYISSTVILNGSPGSNTNLLQSAGNGSIPSWVATSALIGLTGANIASGLPSSILPSTIDYTSSTDTVTAFELWQSSVQFSGGVTISSTVLLNGSPGNNGQVFTSGGNGAIPSWQNSSGGASLSSSNTWTAYQDFTSSITVSGAIYISSTVILNGLPGTSGQLLQSGGNGAVPSWITVTSAGLSSTQTWTAQQTFQNPIVVNTSSATFNGGISISSGITVSTPSFVITSTTTLTSTMSVVEASCISSATANRFITLTLPSAVSSPGSDIMIYDVSSDSCQIRIVGNGSDTIESTGTIFLNAKNQHASLHSLSSNGWASGLGNIQITPWSIFTTQDDVGTFTESVASSTIVCPIYVPVPVAVTGFRLDRTVGTGTFSAALFDMTGHYLVGESTITTISSVNNYLLPNGAIYQLAPGWYRLGVLLSNTTVTISGSNSVNDILMFCNAGGTPANGDLSKFTLTVPGATRNGTYPAVDLLFNGGMNSF